MSDRSSTEIIDREYLEIRAKILELAASCDRIDRADGQSDNRMQKIEKGISILLDGKGEKATRVQLLFSREYSPAWREKFGI